MCTSTDAQRCDASPVWTTGAAATAAATACRLPSNRPAPPIAAPQVVTPWDVAGGADGKIDYNKLVEQVGAAGGVPVTAAIAHPAAELHQHACSAASGTPCQPTQN